MSGDLIGIKYKQVNKRYGEYITEDDEPTQHIIYQAGYDHALTSIKTARVQYKPNFFYIILSDTSGYIHILKGEKDEPESYQPVLVL